MEFVISFDMRAPDFGAPKHDLYNSALDMSAWADAIGFNVVSLGEHHAAPDGYLPSPLPMCAAIAARTGKGPQDVPWSEIGAKLEELRGDVSTG